jgi:NAD(P)-dependent dehydrogenase (short-subunit alcohol dehydrogenase family)
MLINMHVNQFEGEFVRSSCGDSFKSADHVPLAFLSRDARCPYPVLLEKRTRRKDVQVMNTISRGLKATLLTLVFLGAGMIAAACAEAQDAESPAATDIGQDRAVLVTGASSGIGRRTAEVLAANGFFVYAGARKQQDLEALNAIENIQAIRLDVNVQDEIDAAVETVNAGGRGLYGLINNAGVVVLAPLIEVTEEDLAFQMNVNVYGPYRVTKAFAPLLIESRGRVATTGSISGIVTWGLGGPYTMSKHSVEAYTDVLAIEMAELGVQVAVVEPGNYKSRITENMVERMQEKGYTTEGSIAQERLDRILSAPTDRGQFKEPDEVAAAYLHFLTAENPKRRYMVVPNEREAAATIRAHIRRLVQLNEDQPYAFTRDELMAMIDEATADSND